MVTLYDRIITLCESRGIKGGKMCTDIGISKGLLTDLKKGRRTGVSAVTALKIAEYFGMTVDELYGREPLQNEEIPTAQTGSGDLNNAGYYKLNEDNKALIDQMIDKLLKAQSGE